MRTLARPCVIALLLALAGRDARPAAAGLRVAGPGAEPPALQRIGSTEGLLALALTPDGGRAAAAYALDEGQENRAVLRLFDASGQVGEDRLLHGTVRDLLFTDSGTRLLAILHLQIGKRRSETQLIQIDPDRARPRRLLRLPTEARDLEHWSARSSILVAGRNELRSFRLPDLRSGPLYRIGGDNLAVAALPGTDFVVVGRGEELLLVHLGDRPGDPDMPVRERLALPAAVRSLAAERDGQAVLAGLEDGRVLRLTLDPPRLAALGEARIVVALPPESHPAERLARRAEAPSRPATPPEPETVTTAPPAVPAPPPPATRTANTTREPETVTTAPPAAPAPPPPEPASVRPDLPERGDTPGQAQIHGRILGQGVHAVVLWGPDNILLEARRVVPDATGNWSAEGLAPGRYRIQLDAGGARVVISEPASVILDLPVDSRVAAPDFTILRTF